MGFLLVGQRRFAEAWQAADLSLRLEPHEGPTFHLRAALLRHEGRIAEAEEALRQALTHSIDNVYAARELLDLCNSLAEQREALDFIREELKRQVIFGDGLLTYRELAHGTLDAAELLAVLQEAVQERPDLWHAWSAVTLQLMNMDRLEEAWEAIGNATQRYPLLSRLWLDQASVAGPAAMRPRNGGPWKRPARSVRNGARPCVPCAPITSGTATSRPRGTAWSNSSASRHWTRPTR